MPSISVSEDKLTLPALKLPSSPEISYLIIPLLAPKLFFPVPPLAIDNIPKTSALLLKSTGAVERETPSLRTIPEGKEVFPVPPFYIGNKPDTSVSKLTAEDVRGFAPLAFIKPLVRFVSFRPANVGAAPACIS